MFERFTDGCRQALALAQEQASLMGHGHIGTEHLLLGLILEEEGIAARALMELGVSLEAVQERIKETVGRTTGEPSDDALFTPRAKKVLELSLGEVLAVGASSIGTEHLLFGLMKEGEGVAVRVLQDLGIDRLGVLMSVGNIWRGDDILRSHLERPSDEAQAALSDSSDSPGCTGCSTHLALAMRYGSLTMPAIAGLLKYRDMTIPPTSPNSLPLKVDVVYCSICGRVIAMLRAESPS